MEPPHGPIDDLVRAILDGEQVGWPDEPRDSHTGRRVRHLRVVAAIASAHRAQTSPGSDDTPETPRLAPPETWGHLRIIEGIGRGAFGEVYRAWDARLEREVALKLLPVGPDDEATVAEMLREGRLLARVRHSNVVSIHGADHIDGYVGLWMEFVRGRTLEDLLRSGQPLEPIEVARIGVELARALAAVHGAGLIHRDIKAQNVMRDEDGRIMLMDFGAGRELINAASDLTGTPLYLAPELLNGQPATARSDIYSLGVLLFRLSTRSFPVRGRTIQEVRLAHERNEQETLRSVRPDLPTALARAIERAIDPRPDRRHATARDLCSALEAAAVSTSRRRRWSPYAALAVLLAGLAWLALSAGWPFGDEGPVTSDPPAPATRTTASPPPAAVGQPAAGSSGGIAEAPEPPTTRNAPTSEPSTPERDSQTPEVIGDERRVGTVEGTLTDEEGKGVPGANVVLSDVRTHFLPEEPAFLEPPGLRNRDGGVSSGTDGSYQLRGVPPGVYVLTARLQPAGCSIPITCVRSAGPFTVDVRPGRTVKVPPVRLCGARTAPACLALDNQFQQVLVPGFLTHGFLDINASAETTRLLKNMLGPLARNEPTDPAWSEAVTSRDLATLFGQSLANGEKGLSLGENVFTNAEYWRQVGARFRHPLIVIDTHPLIVTGTVVLAGHDRDEAGRSGRSLDLLTKIVFIDGRTGEIVHTTWHPKRVVVDSGRTATAWYFQEMYSFMPAVFRSIMQFLGRAY